MKYFLDLSIQITIKITWNVKSSARSGNDDESSLPLPHCCFERGPRRSITQSVPKKAWKSLRRREILMIERYRTVLTHLRAICADSLTASGLEVIKQILIIKFFLNV
uniref:Uncharacterized protein n=1 Tax=Trichogramma kaykai TaxID=54128 RepID=A0ABD2VWX2_9HYME